MNFQDAISFLSLNSANTVKRPCWNINTLTLIDGVPTFLRDGEVSESENRHIVTLNTINADDFVIVTDGTGRTDECSLTDANSFLAYVSPALIDLLRTFNHRNDSTLKTIEIRVLG